MPFCHISYPVNKTHVVCNIFLMNDQSKKYTWWTIFYCRYCNHRKVFGPSYITFVHTLLKSSISHCTCLSFETLTSYNLLKFINEIGTVQFYDYRQRSRFCQNPFSADFRVWQKAFSYRVSAIPCIIHDHVLFNLCHVMVKTHVHLKLTLFKMNILKYAIL